MNDTQNSQYGYFIDEYSYGLVEPDENDTFVEDSFFLNIPRVQSLFSQANTPKQENVLDLLSNIYDVNTKPIPQNIYQVKELNIINMPDMGQEIGVLLFDRIKGNDVTSLGAWFHFDKKLKNLLKEKEDIWIIDGYSIEEKIPIVRVES
jgi:hypothetical protein